MKSWGAVSILLLCTVAHAAEVTPVQKVIQLLMDMTAKGKDEMHKEQVQFATYKNFCDDTDTRQEQQIGKLTENIERLTANIEKAAAKIEELAASIQHDNNDVSRWQGDLKAEAAVRDIQKAAFDALNKDYSESIDALKRAIAVLKKETADTPQLAQLTKAPLIPKEVKSTLETFLAQDEELSLDAPEANAYEFQSGGIISMLEKLYDKFYDERTALQKEEADRIHAFDLVNRDLEADLANSQARIEEETGIKASTEQQKADDEGQVAEDTTERANAETYKKEVAATCESKANDFAARQKLRAEELEAIAEAVKILESGDVSGAADKHLPASFAQLRSENRSPTQTQAAAYLQAQAKHLNSRVLSVVAQHVADDPFAKVKKMISDLIDKLVSEANEEAEHKQWCDQELHTNEATRNEKTARVEKLHAKVDELNAEITRLAEDIDALNTASTAATDDLATATAERSAEKESNTQTIADAKAALEAVAKATVVLKEFYAKAGEATALVQQAPEIFDKPYQGLGGESGGVVGLLEVIASDFQRLLEETEATEAANANKHKTFTDDTNALLAENKRSVEMKTKEKQDLSQALADTNTDLSQTQTQLTTALTYYDDLKSSCIDSGVSYEDRVAQREAEIESLKSALEILGSFQG